MKTGPQHDNPTGARGLLRRRCQALLFACTAPVCFAQQAPDPGKTEEPFKLSGQVAVGAEYNSNLSVSELESSAGSSDYAGTLEVSGTANWHPNPQFNGEAGYSLTSSRYRDFDTYDLDLHLLYGDVSYDFGPVTLGSNYYFGKAYLGGDPFLELNQYSVYAGKLFGDGWYLRGAYNSVDKSFDTITTRDADNTGFSADVYRFFNSGKTSVSLGYAREDEDTIDPAFRYKADTVRLRANHRFHLLEWEARAQAGLRWQSRDYSFITPGIGVPRDDSQQVIDAKLEVTVAKDLAVIGGYQHGRYDSRLPSAAYSDNHVSLALRLSF